MIMNRLLPIGVLAAGIVIGYSGMHCGISASCPLVQIFSDLAFDLFKPLWMFCLFALPAGFVVLFPGARAYSSWLKFAMWWVPLSVVIIAATENSHNWMPLFVFGKSEAAVLMSSLFTIISLGLIAWKQFGPRNKSK